MQPPKKGLRKISDRNLREVSALVDTLRRVLVAPRPKDIDLDFFSGAQGYTSAGKDGMPSIGLDVDRATGSTVAHEMTHVGQMTDGGKSWVAPNASRLNMPLTPQDSLRARALDRLDRRAGREIPDTARSFAGLRFSDAGGDSEKLPHVVQKTYESLADADGAHWSELDTHRDALSKTSKETPLVRDMLDLFVSTPDYERMKWLAKPKLPKAGVADAVRRK